MRSSLVISSSFEFMSEELKIEANHAKIPANPAAIDPQQQLNVPRDQQQAKQLPATTFPMPDQMEAAHEPAATPAAVKPQVTIAQKKSAMKTNTPAMICKVSEIIIFFINIL